METQMCTCSRPGIPISRKEEASAIEVEKHPSTRIVQLLQDLQ